MKMTPRKTKTELDDEFSERIRAETKQSYRLEVARIVAGNMSHRDVDGFIVICNKITNWVVTGEIDNAA
jgi:hypothetical protein